MKQASTYDYSAYGEPSQTGTTTDFLFTGHQYDTDTNNYYARARYLNPATGRFLSRDTHPINHSNPFELMRYGYTGGDPVNRVDLSGLFAEYGGTLTISTDEDNREGPEWAGLFAVAVLYAVFLVLQGQPDITTANPNDIIVDWRPIWDKPVDHGGDPGGGNGEGLSWAIKLLLLAGTIVTFAPHADSPEDTNDDNNDGTFVGFHGTNDIAANGILSGEIRPSKKGQLGRGFYVYDKNRPSEAIALKWAISESAREAVSARGGKPIALRVFATGYPDQLTHAEVTYEDGWWVQYDASKYRDFQYLTSELDIDENVGQVKFSEHALGVLSITCVQSDQPDGSVCP